MSALSRLVCGISKAATAGLFNCISRPTVTDRRCCSLHYRIASAMQVVFAYAACQVANADVPTSRFCVVAISIDEVGKADLAIRRLDADAQPTNPERRCLQRCGDDGICTYDYAFSDPKALHYIAGAFERATNVLLDREALCLRMQPAAAKGVEGPLAGFCLPYRVTLPSQMNMTVSVPDDVEGMAVFMVGLTPHHLVSQKDASINTIIAVGTEDRFRTSAILVATAIYPDGEGQTRSELLVKRQIQVSDQFEPVAFKLPPVLGNSRKSHMIKVAASGAVALSLAELRLTTAPAPPVGLELEQLGDTVLVKRVFDESSAQRAGIRAGDQILGIDGVAMDRLESVLQSLAASPYGQTAKIEAGRRGKTITLPVRIQEPSPPPEAQKLEEFEGLILESPGHGLLAAESLPQEKNKDKSSQAASPQRGALHLDDVNVQVGSLRIGDIQFGGPDTAKKAPADSSPQSSAPNDAAEKIARFEAECDKTSAQIIAGYLAAGVDPKALVMAAGERLGELGENPGKQNETTGITAGCVRGSESYLGMCSFIAIDAAMRLGGSPIPDGGIVGLIKTMLTDGAGQELGADKYWTHVAVLRSWNAFYSDANLFNAAFDRQLVKDGAHPGLIGAMQNVRREIRELIKKDYAAKVEEGVKKYGPPEFDQEKQ